MTVEKLGAALAAGALMFAVVATPARAASPATEAFLANATPNVDFLDRSSRMALTHSKNARLRDFAHGEAREQTLAANDIDGWVEAAKAPVVASAAGGSATRGEMMTGRSVAIDGQAAQQPQVADLRLPMGQEDLDRLDGMDAAEFDTLYKEKQRNALRQLQSDYEDYIVRGDDPILLSLAQRELPKVKRRLTAIGKM